MPAATQTAAPASLSIDGARRRIRLAPGDPTFFADPSVAYRLIREAGLTRFFWEDLGLWCFAGHAEVNALFRDRRFGREVTHRVSARDLGWPEIPAHLKPFYDVEAHSMLEREPPVHTRLRTLVNRAFVARTVDRLRPRIAALAHALVDAMEGRGTLDLLPTFAEVVPVTIIAEMLGVPVGMAPQLLDWSHRMVAMYQFNRTRAVEDRAVAATEAFVAYLRDTLAERRAAPGEDILSVLIAAEAAGGRLSEDELIATAILLLNAGHEATVHAIGNAVVAILDAGLDPRALFATPDTTLAAAEELLRVAPPLHLFTRYALEPMTLGGIDLAVGDKVGLMIGAANRDPAAFVDPDRLDAARAGPQHVSFGAGIHFCIGAPLARLELQVALPILFARLPRLRLAGRPRVADRYHFHGFATLPVSV